jgi:hypothetical protein
MRSVSSATRATSPETSSTRPRMWFASPMKVATKTEAGWV